MRSRKSLEEVFNMPDVVKDFIDNGIETEPRTQAIGDKAPSGKGPKPARDRKVIDMEEGRSQGGSKPVPAIGREVAWQEPAAAVNLTRTYAKATVQKTIRFHPKIIAEVEALIRQQEATGEKPDSFQQIQNEALELWLSHHRESE